MLTSKNFLLGKGIMPKYVFSIVFPIVLAFELPARAFKLAHWRWSRLKRSNNECSQWFRWTGEREHSRPTSERCYAKRVRSLFYEPGTHGSLGSSCLPFREKRKTRVLIDWPTDSDCRGKIFFFKFVHVKATTTIGLQLLSLVNSFSLPIFYHEKYRFSLNPALAGSH